MTGRGHNGNILNLQVNHWTIKHICVLYVIADPYKTIYIIYTAGVQILFSSQAFGEHWYTEYVDRYHHWLVLDVDRGSAGRQLSVRSVE